MNTKGNTSQDPEHSPQFTMFGKRMNMAKPEAPAALGPQRLASRSREDAEERRTFWLVVGISAIVFAGVFLGIRFFGSKPMVPAAPLAKPQREAQPPAEAQPRGAPPPVAEAPAPAPPPPATAVPRPEESKPEARAPDPTVPRASRVAAPLASRKQRAAPRRPPPPDPYIERLRKEMEQYEREKAQGKYRELPR